MEHSQKVLIVDDNAQVREFLSQSLAGCAGMEVIGCAADGVQALEMIDSLRPDLVLLDLVMPKLDGFGVLTVLAKRDAAPRVIVVSALTQEILVARAIDLGAMFFVAKPFSLEVLKERIADVAAMQTGAAPKPAAARMPLGVVQEPKEMSADEKISTVFITVGIPAHIKGYHYLREAVKMVIANPDIINRITKELYPGIARTFNTSPSKVERAIRHAIEVAWTRGKIENLNDLFGYRVYTKNDKPTNGEFIALIADKLLLERVA